MPLRVLVLQFCCLVLLGFWCDVVGCWDLIWVLAGVADCDVFCFCLLDWITFTLLC